MIKKTRGVWVNISILQFENTSFGTTYNIVKFIKCNGTGTEQAETQKQDTRQ